MNVLFVMMHPGYVRNYESTLRSLAARGHRIHLALQQPAKQAEDRLPERLAAETERITFSRAAKRDDPWRSLARIVRGVMDYLRYLEPKFASAPLLRARVEAQVPLVLPLVGLIARLSGPRGIAWMMRVLQWIEHVIPPSRDITAYIEKHDPDALIATPLVNVASDQVDWFKSAEALGIPSCLAVASWDNLTNKGLIRVSPDLVLVWNDIQKREAVEMHGIPASRVVVTGAQRFDDWFDRRPTLDRDAFCAQAGVPKGKPYILYVGSSPFIAPQEPRFVETWLRALRAAPDARLRDIPVLIRPHPQNAACWRDVDFSKYGEVSIWPRAGANPVTEGSKSDFYHSLCYCECVVGLNTSAFLEAGIVGVPTLTVETADTQGTQEGTLHFHYILRRNGGLLTMASGMDEHVKDLLDAITNREAWRREVLSFVRSFLRPNGLDRPCTPFLVEAIERLGGAGEPGPAPRSPARARRAPRRGRATPSQRLARDCLYPVAAVADRVAQLHRIYIAEPRQRAVARDRGDKDEV